MADPISLTVKRREPDADVIAGLSHLLELAKKGELRALVFVGYDGAGYLRGAKGRFGDRYSAIGAATMLSHEMVRAMDHDAVEVEAPKPDA